PESIARMAEQFAVFAQALVQSPTLPLGQAPLLSMQETAAILSNLDRHNTDVSENIALYRVFENQADSTPDAEAVVCDDVVLTYRQLNERSNQLARYLRTEFSVGPDELVGLCLPRSAEMLIAILAVWKAGGAYVPFEPDLPAERLDLVLAETQCRVILCLSDQRAFFAQRGCPQLLLDNVAPPSMDTDLLRGCSKSNLEQHAQELTSLAYVLYTSGSTGTPKGVMVEHHSLAVLGREMNAWIAPHSRIGWCANYIFDASLQGLLYMCMGRSLVVISQGLKLEPEALCNYARQQRLSVLDCTPSLAQVWLQQWPKDFTPDLLIGGEAISATLWQSLTEYRESGALVYNLYGPTECTVNSTVTLVEGEFPHIGRALAYTQLYILAPGTQSLAPAGSVGELCIGGQGLGRGYLNNPELTAKRFIDNPFYDPDTAYRSKRLYRTGDLVQLLPDGNLAFISRNDHQVKVRGYRIELGEIEQV
ncbi:non-ribosomal peptide synthetase, partial [Rheinheimera gaetbuli]